MFEKKEEDENKKQDDWCTYFLDLLRDKSEISRQTNMKLIQVKKAQPTLSI